MFWMFIEIISNANNANLKKTSTASEVMSEILI